MVCAVRSLFLTFFFFSKISLSQYNLFIFRTWKFCQIGTELLMLLLRNDVPAPVCAVQLITDCCIHESLSIRKVTLFYHKKGYTLNT